LHRELPILTGSFLSKSFRLSYLAHSCSTIPPTRRPRMARQRNAKVLNPQVEALRPYLEGVAKKLAHDLFGPKGPQWGTTLTELEDLALQTRAILSEKFLTLSLEQQAATPPDERAAEWQACPCCQRRFDEPEEPQPRNVATRAGETAWSEPKE
jgi:hypothetical protein